MADSILCVSAEGLFAVGEIDGNQYFCLAGTGEYSASRVRLFLVAAAMGVSSAPIPMSKKLSFVREGSVDGKVRALLTALYASELISAGSDLGGINDLDAVFRYAEPYANSGLIALGDYATSKPEDILLRDWILQLDDLYNGLFGDMDDEARSTSSSSDYYHIGDSV